VISLNRGDLILGTGMAIPVLDAERLMRKRLFEFQNPGVAAGENPVSKAALNNPFSSRRR
jgi:hypothetical protein